MEKINVFIDFDDVILKTSSFVNRKIREVYECASYEYYQDLKIQLRDEYDAKKKDLDELDRRVFEIRSKKKQKDVLRFLEKEFATIEKEYCYKLWEIEEDEKYCFDNLDYFLEVMNNRDLKFNKEKNLYEPFLNYEEVIDIRFLIDDSINFIKELIQNPNVNVEILTHCNSNEEAKCKCDFIRKYIGSINIHILKFHEDEFGMGKKRKVNSKADYVINQVIDDEETFELDDSYILIDDSKRNILDWRNKGGREIIFSPEFLPEFPRQINRMDMSSFIECLNDEEKAIFLKDDLEKKLIKK